MSATVEITETDGQYTAVDSETGATAHGATRAAALAALAIRLDLDEGAIGADETEPGPALRELSDRIGRRFDDNDVSEQDVEDAIEWARSQ